MTATSPQKPITCPLGEMHGRLSTFARKGDGVRCCDFCGQPTTSPLSLKACPLCGDKDEFNPSVSTSYKYANPGTASTDLVESGHFIECDKCGCLGPIKPVEEEAIAAWNTRASIEDEVRELREALTGLVQAVEKDAHENNSISGFTGARLTDARAALSRKPAQPSDISRETDS